MASISGDWASNDRVAAAAVSSATASENLRRIGLSR